MVAFWIPGHSVGQTAFQTEEKTVTSMIGHRGGVTIIGAGFGIRMATKLRRAGTPFTILEKRDRVGGVWRDNTYPGAACDIPSHPYSYSFEPSHHWSRKYGTQPEIQSYIDHAFTFDYRRQPRCFDAVYYQTDAIYQPALATTGAPQQ